MYDAKTGDAQPPGQIDVRQFRSNDRIKATDGFDQRRAEEARERGCAKDRLSFIVSAGID